MPLYKIPSPDLSGISQARRDFLTENRYRIYFRYKLNEYSNEKYLPWEKIRYLSIPEELESSEELWFVIQSCRFKRNTPITDKNGRPFSMERVDFLEELLHKLDLWLGGSFLSRDFSKSEQAVFLQNGMAEEAISSSQLEWAMTSSKVAREMIAKNRRPTSRDEKMILNNYQVMNYIKDELVHEKMSREALLYIQNILTKDIMDNPDEAGRWRVDADEIVVEDGLEWVTYHVPPNQQILQKEIDALIRYANDEDESGFTHPFIKAVLLHFWIGYLHPFCDGNGRTARAIFYWYLLKKWYWGFNYIPISQAIKNSKKQYVDAYIYSEQDENNLTYFLVYIANKTKQAFEEFDMYIQKKRKEQKGFSNELAHLGFNDRQNKLLWYFLANPKSYTNNSIHKNYYNVSINTAKSDLEGLYEKWFLKKEKQGLYMNYFPTEGLEGMIMVK